ncbi:MAG: hypothetical protein Q7S40_24440 [Opitutaceae bacterium]|nr:hypothetical protein [Opitutaceae bacterium]
MAPRCFTPGSSLFACGLLFIAPLASVCVADDASTERHVQAVFSALRPIESMQPQHTYTLPAGGRKVSGRNDDFLRLRTAKEISAGGYHQPIIRGRLGRIVRLISLRCVGPQDNRRFERG